LRDDSNEQRPIRIFLSLYMFITRDNGHHNKSIANEKNVEKSESRRVISSFKSCPDARYGNASAQRPLMEFPGPSRIKTTCIYNLRPLDLRHNLSIQERLP
jgi:hypothetical protein